MRDQNNQNEDFVDIGSALADLMANVDGSRAITVESLGQLQDELNGLWQQTEGNEQAHAQIEQAWNKARVIAEQNAALAFQVAASSSIAHTALEEKRAAVDELESLQGAIEENDEDDVRLRDFAEWVREQYQNDFEAYVMDDIYGESMAEAYEEIRDEVQNRVESLAGCGWKTASLFVNILMGRRAQFTPYQAELFEAFIKTFDELVAAQEAANGHR